MNFINRIVIDNKSNQNTLKNKILFSGVGVHNGRAVTISLEPSDIDTGIIFKRIDISNNNEINAVIDNVVDSSLCTKIANAGGACVSTIEHIMAAFSALDLDNVLVKINAPELPALDGSSSEYIKKILKAGIKTQHKKRKFLKIMKKVEVRDGNRFISILPSNELSINVSINYPNTIIGFSEYFYQHSKDNFIKNLSMARTYTLSEDIEKMRTAGLAIGGNLNNAIVVDKYRILNPDGLRLDKEFVKHKALDCIGDFYLLGMPLIGKINCFAPGHNLNQKFLRKILDDQSNYEIDYIVSENSDEKFFNLVKDESSSQNITNVA